ncbi:hypothetical protein PENTCL1PPCAC_16690, partial [Pristionchus entomophagus]
YPSDCSEEYSVICQKHMFDRDHQPSNLGDDDLAPGKWWFAVETDFGGEYKGCDVEVRVQSALQVEFGFVDGLRRDEPHPVANVDSNENRVISSIAIGQEKTQNSFLQNFLLRSASNSSTLLEASTSSYRLGCSYEYVSQPLSCDLTQGHDFSVVMIGEDDTGNTFQRYSTSLCTKWYVCENGGAYYNGECLCPDYYAGDLCETPLCQNGGILSSDGRKCTCPSGYGGDVCQFVHCEKNSRTYFTNDEKSLVFVIEKSENTAYAIQDISNHFTEIVQKMWDQHQGWIGSYMILTFTVDGTIEPLDIFYEPTQFSMYLSHLSNLAYDYPGSCQMPIWKALDSLFDSPLSVNLPGSEVVIVSAAAPSDVDLASLQATMEKFDIQTPVIDYLHIEAFDCPVDDWKKDLGDFDTFLSTTGGIIFRAAGAFVGMGLKEFLPTRHAPQRLSYSDPLNCKDNDIYILVDFNMEYVFVILGGSNPKIEVETPLKDFVEVSQMWTTDQQKMWMILPQYPGIYKITVNSDVPDCFPMIYGTGEAFGYGTHAAQVFSGFIQSYNNLDTPKPYAVYGAVNFPVFNLLVRQEAEPPVETLYMTRMSRRDSEGKDEESYTSDVDRRDGCSYTYVGKAFTCVADNDVITLSVSGVDSYNQPFTRQSTTYCKKDTTNAMKSAVNVTNLLF